MKTLKKTLKERNRLKIGCNRKQYPYSPRGTLSLHPLAIAMPVHQFYKCLESMHATIETNNAIMRYTKSPISSPTVAKGASEDGQGMSSDED